MGILRDRMVEEMKLLCGDARVLPLRRNPAHQILSTRAGSARSGADPLVSFTSDRGTKVVLQHHDGTDRRVTLL